MQAVEEQIPIVQDPALPVWRLRRVWLGALAVYVLAVLLRLAFLVQADDHPLYQFLILDERSQHEVAAAVARGDLPPNAPVKAPFYAYALGMLYKLIDVESLHARYVQVFIVSLAPVVVFAIGRRLFGDLVGLIAGLLAAVFWTFVFFSAELLDVSLACLLYLLLAWMLIAVDDRRWWKWLVAGGLIGLGGITRPNILAFAPVLAVAALVLSRRDARVGYGEGRAWSWIKIGLARVGVLVLGTGLAIAPVTLRNVIVANEPMLIAFFGGYNLYVANNPQSDGKNAVSPKLDITVRHPGLDLEDPWVKWDEGFQAAYLYAAEQLGPRPTYAEAQKFYVGLTWKYIRHYPWKFVTDTLKRFCWMFNAYEFPSNKDFNYLRRHFSVLWGLSWLHFGIVGPIGVVGLVMATRVKPRDKATIYTVAMVLSLALPGVFFVINARYRLPVVYLLMPFVAYGAVRLASSWASIERLRRGAGYLVGLAGLLVFSNLNLFGYRPPHHEYMLFSLAGACGATGREDLMAETVAEIEEALADDSHPPMLHPWAMTCLFNYYCAQGDLEKAAHYGVRLLDREEPVDAAMLSRLVTVFSEEGLRGQAERALAGLAEVGGEGTLAYVAQGLLAYGKGFGQVRAVRRASEIYSRLLRLNPTVEVYRRGLAEAEKLLAGPASGPSSQPGAGDNRSPFPP